VSRASGEIITFCDPDTFFFDDWYTPLYQTLLSDEKIGAVSSKLINPLTDRIIDFGMSFTKWNAGHPTKDLHFKHPLAQNDRIVQAACSAVMMTRKEDFIRVGGMDEHMPFAYPDCDYCFKLKTEGLQTIVVASSNVYHKGSSDPNNSKYYAFGYLRSESKGMFYARHYEHIEEDLHLWFSKTIAWVFQKWPNLSSSFVLLDFTTMYNRDYYYHAFETNGLDFLDKQVVTMPKRDNRNVVLYSHISFEYIDMATPILYFLDTYRGIIENQLWFRMRDISRDIVADRHGNIFPLQELINGNC